MPASWSGLSPLRSTDGLLGADQRHAAAGDDAFLDGSTGRVQGVFDARFLLLHLDFGRGTDLDQRHTAGQLGDTLLELFLVVVAGGFVDLDADLLDAAFDGGGIAAAIDDGRVFLRHFDALGLAQVLQGGLLQRQADFLGDDRAAGENGDVFQHGLAAVTEARRLHGAGLEDAADVVHHQRRQGFALDVLGDDQQRTPGLGHLLQHRQQVANVGDSSCRAAARRDSPGWQSACRDC